MSDIFGGVEPPAWLQKITQPSEPGMLGQIFGQMVGGLADSAEIAIGKAEDKQKHGISTSWIKELPGSIKPGLTEARLNIQNPLWKMQAQQAQLNLAQQGLEMQNQQSQIDARKTKMQMQQHDQDVLPQWLQEHPTWESRQDAEPPKLFTTEGQRMFRDVQLGDAGNIKHKAIVEGIGAYSKSVAELQKIDPIAAAPFAQEIGKVPTVDMQSKLGDALSKAKSSIPPKATASIQNVNQIADWEKQAKEAEAGGDTEKAKDLRGKATELRDQLKGQSMTLGYDDQGRPIVSVGKGGQSTVATQTMAQGKLLQYENATELMNYLQHNLTDQHVGFAGAGGELIVDKTLEQVVPGVANKDRIKVRTTLTGLRESLLREMSDDRTGRFSVADRQEIEKALPSSGVFESKTDAMERINRVREILASRGKVYAKNLGVRPPMWSLGKDEIIRMYQDGLASKADPNSPDFKKKYLTKEEAIDALTRFQ